MKKLLFILLVTLFACPVDTFAATETQVAVQYSDPGSRAMKKHRKKTYGKRKGTKGTSCKKAHKIMKKRGNW